MYSTKLIHDNPMNSYFRFILIFFVSGLCKLSNANLSKFTKIQIEGYKSENEIHQQKIQMTAPTAELNQSLKSQRLLQPSIFILSAETEIIATANQALFRENEILMVGNVQIKIIALESSLKIFELKSPSDLLSLDLSAAIIRSSTVEANIKKHSYLGHGIRIDLARKDILWISDVHRKNSKIKLNTPLKMKIF